MSLLGIAPLSGTLENAGDGRGRERCTDIALSGTFSLFERPFGARRFEDFQSIFADRIVGDFGLSGGGAAGFELDGTDIKLGTPHNAVMLATSESPQNHFMLVPEGMLTNDTTISGESHEDLIRADMVYFNCPGDGAVFSVCSITFCGSLSHNNYGNNISRIVENVIRRFTAGEA